eukprot:227243-Chlamydomonas_euryale.AAC.20
MAQARAQSWQDVDTDAVEPFSLVHEEVQIVSERLRGSVLSSVPALRHAAEYFFRPGVEGKRLRPTLALLMASALSPSPPQPEFLKVGTCAAREIVSRGRGGRGRTCTVATGGAQRFERGS